MPILLRAPFLALTILASAPALAGARCNAPMANWQPREALVEKLRASGWTVRRIKTDDGCYKVYGLDRNGARIKAKFDPASLMQLESRTDAE
jgi:hypothetical protein